MKLFYHLYGYLLLGMIVLIGIDEYLSFQAEIKQYEAEMITNAVQNGRAISGMISNAWQEIGETKALKLIQDASDSGTLTIRWVWPHVLLSSFTGSDTDKEQLRKIIKGEIVSLKMQQEDGTLLRFTYVPVDLGNLQPGAIELSQTLLPLKEFSRRMLGRAFTITIFLVLVSGLILYFFIDRRIRLPLNNLMDQAKRIGQGDLSANNAIVGNDEFAEMARTMNVMCSRLLIANEKISFEYDARLKTLKQLRHTERLSSFGMLSAGIAHELGTPLNVVDGRAKMIISENLNHQEIRDCATIIKKQAERMAAIIKQLLDFTRIPTHQDSTEDVGFLIKQVFQLLHPMASKQQVSLILTKEENAEAILRADFPQLQQVMVNLLMNAIQAMPDGGKVEVNLANEMLPVSLFDEQTKLKYLKVHIQDEGEGICKENLARIFTPFFTTKKIGAGTGLGLSIAHGIVEDHEGWIDIESTARKGACFTVYLPMKDQEK